MDITAFAPHLAALAAVFIGLSLYLLWKQFNDRSKYRLSAEEMMLFARLPGVSPHEFKQLLALAEWHNPKVSMQLTKLGELPHALYYVLEGKVEVNRDGRRFSVGPHAFIGELAFLRNKPATATTFATIDSFIVSWEQEALRALMKNNVGIRKAIDDMLSIDMAEKMARTSLPHLQEQSA